MFDDGGHAAPLGTTQLTSKAGFAAAMLARTTFVVHGWVNIKDVNESSRSLLIL
jgi:hypothetical protein